MSWKECENQRDSMGTTDLCPLRFDGRWAGDSDAFDKHLEDCTFCRSVDDELHEVRAQLKSVPIVPFPKAALDEVFYRTVDSPKVEFNSITRFRKLSRIAAVLLLASTPVIGWLRYEAVRASQIDQSVSQINYVLGTAARALRAVEEETVNEVLLQPGCGADQSNFDWIVGSYSSRQQEIGNMILADWKLIRLVGSVASIAFFAAAVNPAAAVERDRHRGYVDGSSFASLADEDDMLIEVTLSGPMLKMAAGAIGQQVEGAGELLGGIHSINAVVVGIDDAESKASKLVGKLTEELEEDGWERLARVREDDVRLAVFVLPTKDGQLDGITVVVAEKSEKALVFANIAGRIDLEAVAELGMNLDIPGLEHLKGQAFKSEYKKHKKKHKR